MRAAFGLALLILPVLGGCGQSDTQIRDELRAQMMNRCSRQIAPNTADLPGFDSDAYCRCVTDKAIGERSLGELKELFAESKREQMIAQGRQAGAECLALQQGGAQDKAGPVPSVAETGNSASSTTTERERPPAKSAPAEPRPSRPDEAKEPPRPRAEPAAPARPPAPRPEPEPAIDDEEEEPGDAE